MRNLVPAYVWRVVEALEARSFEAYLVGGAVRDLILGRRADDYDIATNARMDELKLVLEAAGMPVTGEVGQAFGVALVNVEGHILEVASFRNETYGADAHKPAEVWYCEKLSEDLGRRDFTINALALNSMGKLVDLYDGQEDLRAKLLRTVGNADKRFEEDALRMFRACRFIAQLGFKADEKIMPAIKRNLERVHGLSLERVKVELEKMLEGSYVADGFRLLVASGLAAESCRLRLQGEYRTVAILPELSELVGVPQNTEFHDKDVWEHTLQALSNGDHELTVQWALLLHDIAKGAPGVRGYKEDGTPTDHGHAEMGAQMAERILSRLHYGRDFTQRVVWLVQNHMRFGMTIGAGDEVLLRWLRQTARSGLFRTQESMVEAFRQLTVVCLADLRACRVTNQEVIMAESYAQRLLALAEQMPVHTSELAVTGQELAEVVAEPKHLATLMPNLLLRVQDGTLVNGHNALLEAARAWQQRQEQS